MGAAGPGGEQDTRNGVAGRSTGQERQQARSTYIYNVKELRDREIDVARHAEQVYEQFVRGWQRRAPTKRRTGAAHEGATMKAARPS